MCGPELLIASAVVGAGASVYSGVSGAQQARSQAEFARYNADLQNQQVKEQQELAMIAASEQEVERMREYRRLRAANEAIIASSGVGQNMGFLEGADDFAKRLLEEDLAAMRLSATAGQNRFATQIAVNRAQADFTAGIAAMQGRDSLIRGASGAAAQGGSYAINSARIR
jgi:hypothetical protein